MRNCHAMRSAKSQSHSGDVTFAFVNIEMALLAQAAKKTFKIHMRSVQEAAVMVKTADTGTGPEQVAGAVAKWIEDPI